MDAGKTPHLVATFSGRLQAGYSMTGGEPSDNEAIFVRLDAGQETAAISLYREVFEGGMAHEDGAISLQLGGRGVRDRPSRVMDTARAMTEENVEIVRRTYDAWNRRDEAELLALSDPEVEFVNSPTAVEPGTRHGVNEVLTVARMQWDILLDGRQEIDRIYDRGEEIVVVLGRLSRRMPEGDARIEDQVLVSWTVRDGKVVRTEILGFGKAEVEKGLKAAGLSE